ncbi:MAG: DUF1844 domain-containing protein [Planctomycetota bacterium]
MSEKKVDHEWKKKAQDEKERLSRQADETPAQPAEASFPLIVSSFTAQALIALGDIKNPVTGKQERDLDAAKFSIDVLQVLADKTEGNLTDDEKKMLQGALYDLRMRYVQASS